MNKAGLTIAGVIAAMAAAGGALAQQEAGQAAPASPFQMTETQSAPAVQSPAPPATLETVSDEQNEQEPQAAPTQQPAEEKTAPEAAAPRKTASGSLYGCTGLESLDPAVLEGPNGFFFTVKDDIAMQQVADPALVESISDLAKRLRQRGTVLVYAPVPSKSQAMPDEVPDAAWLYGYNKTVNEEIYAQALSRLKAASVVAVDLQAALGKAGSATPPYQKADPLWTPEGARLAAEAVAAEIKALPAYHKANLMTFKTTQQDEISRPSELRTALQPHCSEPLPPVSEKRFETTGQEAYAADRPFNVLGSDAPPPAVLVGSRFSAGGQSHFDGFLKQAAGLDVANRASADAYPFQSIDAYLKSQAFQDHPPLFLIWEVPAGANLARFGPLPWLTLSANAAGDCTAEHATCGKSGADQ